MNKQPIKPKSAHVSNNIRISTMPEHEFLAPSGGSNMEPGSSRMTNDDFRKLMMTPRTGGGGSTGPSATLNSLGSTPVPPSPSESKTPTKSTEKAEKRKKKKSFYAKLKRQEDDKMAELAAKYRDRAAERRDGSETDQGESRSMENLTTSSGYHAVAPDMKSSHDAAERRRKMIQESKYLGGDMEHTHLVKGLDFALLQKVRSEIASHEQESSEEEAGDAEDDNKVIGESGEKKSLEEIQSETRTVMARNVVRNVFNLGLPKVNELFLPGRMAYIIELDEEYAESDIPTTSIRSKADVDGEYSQVKATLSTNDIVINKLTQILSYLRAGSRNKKKKRDKHAFEGKREDEILREEQKAARLASLPIYDDSDLYESRDRHKRDRRDRRDRERDRDRGDRRDHRDRDRNRDRDHYRDEYKSRSRRDHRNENHEKDKKKSSYFDNKEELEEERNQHSGGLSSKDRDYIRKLNEREKQKEKRVQEASKGGISLASAKPDSYNECYPGLMEMNDAIDDSDDETDYSKMDLGNKKGAVNRWDFDTQEEYGDYMSSKEALPKAAFQFGVKASDGRKTRTKMGAKSEKAKLDREWTQISQLIDKRKSKGGGVGGKRQKID